jgi:MFS family permease
VVAALFAVTYGISTPLAAYGVFLPVLAETFGWSRGAISAALSLNLVLGGVTGFVVGALADRHGPRLLLVTTVILASAGFGLVATVHHLWQLYLFVGVLAGVGMSGFYLLGASTVAHWFVARRGLALAVVLVGFNLGYITGGPLAAWLIDAVGWRHAYAWLAGGCGLVTLAAALSVRLPRGGETAALRDISTGLAGAGPRGSASSVRPGATLREALADPRQWYLNGSWLLQGALALMLSVHIVPFARDQGIGLAGASLALTMYGLGSALGRLSSGALSDRLGPRATIYVAYGLTALALLTLRWIPAREMLLVSVALFGAGFAATDTMVVKVVPDLFGMRAIGAIMGILTLGWRCGAALGPAAAGFLHDLTGSYAIAFGAAPLAVVASAVLFALGTSSRAGGGLPRRP